MEITVLASLLASPYAYSADLVAYSLVLAGAAVTVRAATNCDEVELFLNDRSLGRQRNRSLWRGRQHLDRENISIGRV